MFRIILIILGCIFAVFALGMGCFGAFIALNNRPAGEAKEVLAAAQTGAPKAIVVYQPARTGVTTKAAHQIAKALQENGYEVTLNHPGSFLEQDLSAYSVVMFGSPVYIGQPSKVLLDYMKSATGLEGKKVYLFTTGTSNEPVDLDAMAAALPGVQIAAREKFFTNGGEVEAKARAFGLKAASK
jgi:flavodoxin